MNYLQRLTVVRHGESSYNTQAALKNRDPAYRAFKEAFNNRHNNPALARALAEPLLAQAGVRVLNTPDLPLTKEGQLQARATGRALKSKIPLPDIVLASPYLRAQETLKHMAAGWPEFARVEQREEPALRDQEMGQSAQYFDLRLFLLLHPEEDERRTGEGPYKYRYPEGENMPDICHRVAPVIDSLHTSYPGGDALLITHQATKLAIRIVLEQLTPEQFMHLEQSERPINCGTTRYEYDTTPDGAQNLVLRTYNEQLYEQLY